MTPNKNTPGANGGAVRNVASQFYRAPDPRTIADWLNPRRRLYCEKVVSFLAWHGGKMYLPDHSGDVRAETGLDTCAVDRAVDDLFALGAVDVRMWGDRCCVELLSTDIDALAAGPKGGGR